MSLPQLWHAPTSPFARKVRIAAHELGQPLERVMVNPWTDERLRRLNPLAKVPTLVTGEGRFLYELAVICTWLDGGARRLVPDGTAQLDALLLQALADGIATAAGRLFADEARPEPQRSEHMMARFAMTIDAGLDELESNMPLAQTARIGEIATAAALGYLDFRWPGRD